MTDINKFQETLKQTQKEALQEIRQADELEGLEQVRIKYLGRKGIITSLLKSLKDFPE
jgi:phenylalanyl-tRNA synthetase alpha chain